MQLFALSRMGVRLFVALAAGTHSALAQVNSPVSPPQLVNKNGGSDTGIDFDLSLVSNGQDVWTCIWLTNDPVLTNGGDTDIFWAYSRNLGANWSNPAPLAAAFTTDTGISSTDISPDLATTGGTRMAVWASSRLGGAGGKLGIYSAYSSSTTTNWVNTLPVNTAFASDAIDDMNPVVAGANSTYVVVWERADPVSNRDLWFSRTTSNGGSTWSTPARIDANSATDTGTDTGACISTDGLGNWVVVYSSSANHFGTGTDSELYAYRSADDGLTWSGPVLVNSSAGVDGTSLDFQAALTVDKASGTWMCVFVSRHTFGGTTGGDLELVWSKSVDFGATWSPIAIANTDFATDATTTNGDQEPSVHADQHGRIMVSWMRHPVLDGDIYTTRTDDLGATWTTPVLMHDDGLTDTSTDFSPQIFADQRGHWLNVWDSLGEHVPGVGNDGDLFVVRYLIPDTDYRSEFCYGYTEDSNSARCPCSNDAVIGSRQGCLNSNGTGGQLGFNALLSASAPSQSITAAALTPGAAVLMFQGSGILGFGIGSAFGDGRLCVAGTLDRLGVAFANGFGFATVAFPPVGVSAGATRYYQAWYRDSASFCTQSTFNLSNAFGQVWSP